MGVCFSREALPPGQVGKPVAAPAQERPACCTQEEVVQQAAAASQAAPSAAAVAAPGAAQPSTYVTPDPTPAAVNLLGGPVTLVDTTVFPGEQARDCQLRSCCMLDTPPEPRFDAITKLMASIFKTPVSLLTLIVDDRVWFKSKVGPFGTCVARDGSWCNYILVPTKPEVLITEDASVDVRFAGNPYVAGVPHIKFYAGAPLVGTGGMRYGTLCVVDLKPRSFSAEMYSMLVNFADLAVQELERDQDAAKFLMNQAASFADSHARMGKAVKKAIDGVAMLDVRSKPWPMLYANESFAKAAGQDVGACTSGGFWDQFEPVDADKMALGKVDEAVAAGRPVRVTVRSKASGQVVTLVLRPAATDQLFPDRPIGVPNWVRSELELSEGALAPDESGAVGTMGPELASCFFMAVVERDVGLSSPEGAAGLPLGTPVSQGIGSVSSVAEPGTPELGGERERPPRSMMPFGDWEVPASLAGLNMGPLIGSGSFAKVYRGTWRGSVVAIKVVDCDRRDSVTEDVMAEAFLSKGLVHDNIIRTFAYDINSRIVTNGHMAEKGTVFIIQQHCNRGTLIDAVEKGWFRQELTMASPPHMATILRTLRDVASGMAYLHEQSIIHRDLTGNNVLLDLSEGDPRGFMAYVADFGLARIARGGSITTESFGTVTHMPPETLADGVATPAADVWSFGVLCWEMYSGTRAYCGMRPVNVVYTVMSGKKPLELPASAPAGYTALMQRCLSRDPQARPAFKEVIADIDRLLAAEAGAGVGAPTSTTAEA